MPGWGPGSSYHAWVSDFFHMFSLSRPGQITQTGTRITVLVSARVVKTTSAKTEVKLEEALQEVAHLVLTSPELRFGAIVASSKACNLC